MKRMTISLMFLMSSFSVLADQGNSTGTAYINASAVSAPFKVEAVTSIELKNKRIMSSYSDYAALNRHNSKVKQDLVRESFLQYQKKK